MNPGVRPAGLALVEYIIETIVPKSAAPEHVDLPLACS